MAQPKIVNTPRTYVRIEGELYVRAELVKKRLECAQRVCELADKAITLDEEDTTRWAVESQLGAAIEDFNRTTLE